jgi:hypothetical protein
MKYTWFRAGLAFLFVTFGMAYADAGKPPPQTIWKLPQATHLNGIAKMAYGHEAYARMIAIYNRLDPQKVAPKGSVIHAPKLPDLFSDLGLMPAYKEPFERIFEVIARYRAILPDYGRLRRAANGYYRAARMELPPHISYELKTLAEMMEESIMDIDNLTTPTGNTPTHMLRQFRSAADELRNLAKGNMDGYGYDQDMVEQRIAHGFANAVGWSRE